MATLIAALVLDAGGCVVAANASARELWGAKKVSLVGRPFADMVGTDSGSSAGESGDWEAMKKSALDRDVVVSAQPIDGGAPCQVRMRLERAHGGGGTYMVTAAVVSRP